MPAKIAFCFLLYDTIQHDCIWKAFFKGNELMSLYLRLFRKQKTRVEILC